MGPVIKLLRNVQWIGLCGGCTVDQSYITRWTLNVDKHLGNQGLSNVAILEEKLLDKFSALISSNVYLSLA